MRRSSDVLALVFFCALLASCSGASPDVRSSPTPLSEGPSQPKPFVDESKLPFAPIPATAAKQHWGVQQKAGYRIEVPEDWNGQLVMFAHGFHGDGPELTVDGPPIRAYLVRNGFA